MMQDFSMYVLDIAMNAVAANSNKIIVEIVDSLKHNYVSLQIIDNGKGMSKETQERVLNPFYTSRTTRKVGLGIPFLKSLADCCNGCFSLTSKVGEGTTIGVKYQRDHWDAPPLGRISESIVTLIQGSEDIHWIFSYTSDRGTFELDTNQIKGMLEGVSICEPSIIVWLKEYMIEQLELLK